MEIIADALKYPIENIRAIGIYLLFSIVMIIGLVIIGIGIGVGSEMNSYALSVLICAIGVIITALMLFLIQGYVLDVVKTGINRENEAPQIDFIRQLSNGLKLFVVALIYIGIPVIIMALLTKIHPYLSFLGIIIYIVAIFACIMAQCRLAKTDRLSEALNVPEAIKDISRVEIKKFIMLLLILAAIGFVLSLISSFIQRYSSPIGSILTVIFTLFMAFVQSRAYGLLYSNIE